MQAAVSRPVRSRAAGTATAIYVWPAVAPGADQRHHQSRSAAGFSPDAGSLAVILRKKVVHPLAACYNVPER